MSDVKQCDRCGSVFSRVEWRSNARIEATLKEHTKGATAYSPDEYDLCADCSYLFVEWVMDDE